MMGTLAVEPLCLTAIVTVKRSRNAPSLPETTDGRRAAVTDRRVSPLGSDPRRPVVKLVSRQRAPRKPVTAPRSLATSAVEGITWVWEVAVASPDDPDSVNCGA